METNVHYDGIRTHGLALCALAGVLSLSASPAGAAVLDFSGDICGPGGNAVCTDGSFIGENYGDIAGVLDVQYRNLQGNPSLTTLRFWNGDYNDLSRVAWTDGGDGNSRAEIFLKPLNGDVVTLKSFDLGAWPDTQRTTSFTILDGDGNLLADSGGTITIGIQPGNLHNTFDFTGQGIASATGIRIQWGPSAFNVGIDNIDFQVGAVPLPAPAWLLGGGLLTLAARRRRAR
jgi:hypothetical protein